MILFAASNLHLKGAPEVTIGPDRRRGSEGPAKLAWHRGGGATGWIWRGNRLKGGQGQSRGGVPYLFG
jgi:hypothetical protein